MDQYSPMVTIVNPGGDQLVTSGEGRIGVGAKYLRSSCQAPIFIGDGSCVNRSRIGK